MAKLWCFRNCKIRMRLFPNTIIIRTWPLTNKQRMAIQVIQSSTLKHLSITLTIFSTFLLIFTINSFFQTTTSTTKPLKNPTQTSKLHFHNTFISLSSNNTISNYHKTLTLNPHLSGTKGSLQVTNFIKTHFQKLGLTTKTTNYNVLLSYPKRVSLTAHFNTPETPQQQLHIPDDNRVVEPYHAYAPSGAYVAPAVYVNYGTEDDYNALDEIGVHVSGCIVLVKRGETVSRGDLVRKAAQKGAVAVLTYAPGTGAYVKGVERGTVMRGVGDPLSPGWSSVIGGERLRRDDVEVVNRFPEIPSMPLSYESAEIVLRSLEGSDVPLKWRVGSGMVHKVGPGPILLNFSYQGEEKMATISDVFAVIEGWEEPDRYVLLGNHRDAWTYGAVDPNSGTAALLDVARRYAYLMGLGWRPRRTIILCSWDAEEFGMIGSTEWVEDNILNLGSKAVAYLNVDCAAQGPGLFPSATPQLDDLLIDITKKVKDPDVKGVSIYEEWTTRNKGVNIQRLSGVNSDFAAFLQHAGVPSLDLYFGKDFPVYHTAFDSYDWMTTYGDPLFHRHVAAAELWGLLALRLADDPILPFNYCSYAMQLQEYTNTLSNMLDGRVSVVPITTSIQHFLLAAKEIQEEAKKLRLDESQSDLVLLKARMLNDRLMLAERGLLDSDGLLGSKWFKHLVYGPTSNPDTKSVYFPSISNAISQTNTSEHEATVQHEIWKVARAIQRATDALRGDLP